jgi:dTDP-4-dehydrorhamnose 3,5-epimerase
MTHPTTAGINGVSLLPTTCHADPRGCLTELYRADQPGSIPVVQWNVCRSRAGVVRGVHVHVDYDEVYTIALGHVVLALHDIRPESPTFGRSLQIDWRPEDDVAVVIPRGVAHVLRCLEDSVLLLGLSGHWNGTVDVLGCQWDDAALGFAWEAGEVVRSERDRTSGSHAQMRADYLLARQALAALTPGTALA